MAKHKYRGCKVLFGPYDISGTLNEVSIDDESDTDESTNFGSRGFYAEEVILAGVRANINGFVDPANAPIDIFQNHERTESDQHPLVIIPSDNPEVAGIAHAIWKTNNYMHRVVSTVGMLQKHETTVERSEAFSLNARVATFQEDFGRGDDEGFAVTNVSFSSPSSGNSYANNESVTATVTFDVPIARITNGTRIRITSTQAGAGVVHFTMSGSVNASNQGTFTGSVTTATKTAGSGIGPDELIIDPDKPFRDSNRANIPSGTDGFAREGEAINGGIMTDNFGVGDDIRFKKMVSGDKVTAALWVWKAEQASGNTGSSPDDDATLEVQLERRDQGSALWSTPTNGTFQSFKETGTDVIEVSPGDLGVSNLDSYWRVKYRVTSTESGNDGDFSFAVVIDGPLHR